MKRVVLFSACIVLLLVVSGCSQPESQPVQPAQSPVATTAPPVTTVPVVTTPAFVPKETTPTVSDNTISIQKMAFNPSSLTVKAGAIVRWVNNDAVPHTVTFTKASGINPSPPLSGSQSFSVKFDEPGTFAYSCSIHPSMQGKIIVE